MYIDFFHDDDRLNTYVATPNSDSAPLVVVAHAWRGQSEFERRKADELARRGYIAVAYDLYGDGKLAANADEARALMTPYASNRLRLRDRFNAILTQAKEIDGVDPDRTAAIGFCFGGMCVLELARSGAQIDGVVSFHGLLSKSDEITETVESKVLILHGWDDPMAPPDDVTAVAMELTTAGADWQIHAYGRTSHAFTNREANDPDAGLQYHRDADRRSDAAMLYFLEECFS